MLKNITLLCIALVVVLSVVLLTNTGLASIKLGFDEIKSRLIFQSNPLVSTNLIETTSETDLKLQLPSVEQIFSIQHEWIATLSSSRKRVMIATGDVIPARSVNEQEVIKNDFRWPFIKTADFISSADITFINLETPLLKNCLPTSSGMVFCGSDRNIEGLNFTGVDVVSLANNHAGNYGLEGVQNTIKLLDAADILVTGVDGPVYKEVRGVQFAFLGYNDISSPQPGISNFVEQKMKQEIAMAKQVADVVIVTLHWGVEYRSQPDERQKYLAHLVIDYGADLIIGNHPHWIQPVEIYKGKLITYAHGNFVFDQMWSQKTREGVVGKYTFYDKQLVDVEFFPVQIDDYGQPHLSESVQEQAILDDMKRQSTILAGFE